MAGSDSGAGDEYVFTRTNRPGAVMVEDGEGRNSSTQASAAVAATYRPLASSSQTKYIPRSRGCDAITSRIQFIHCITTPKFIYLIFYFIFFIRISAHSRGTLTNPGGDLKALIVEPYLHL